MHTKFEVIYQIAKRHLPEQNRFKKIKVAENEKKIGKQTIVRWKIEGLSTLILQIIDIRKYFWVTFGRSCIGFFILIQ